MASAPPPPMPSRVGRYELLSPIASGGMASVYLARARGVGGFEREVALKLTHAHLRENPEFAAVLVEEAKLAGRIRHTNVVSVLDVGEDPLGLFLVMDYVEGDTLHGLQRKHLAAKGEPLQRGIAMRILLDALAGLHAAHELRGDDGEPLGVVHRDFTPQNVLVGTDGVAKLADFGIAKATSRGGHTATGIIKGKARYMAPEQARGHAVDRRCDVWAAGVVAWELLAGRKLHEKVDDVPLLLKVVTEPPPKLRAAGVGVSPELEAVVAAALEMDLQRRCPTAADLARQMRDAFTGTGAIAEPAQVGALVNELAGPGIAARRTHAQMRLDATAPSPPQEMTRTSDRVAMTATIAETEALTTVAVGPVRVPAAPAVPQGTADVDSADLALARPSRRRWPWAVGAGGALAAIVATALLRNEPPGLHSSAAQALSSPPDPSAWAAPATPSAPPSDTASAGDTPSSSSPSAPNAPTAPTGTTRPSGPHRTRPAAAGSVAPKSTSAPPPGKLAPPPW